MQPKQRRIPRNMENNRVPEQPSQTPNQPPDTDPPASSQEVADVPIADHDYGNQSMPYEGRWDAARFVPEEGEQVEAVWIADDKMRKHSWRAALVGTLALMALVVTTAVGAPRLLQRASPIGTTPTVIV